MTCLRFARHGISAIRRRTPRFAVTALAAAMSLAVGAACGGGEFVPLRSESASPPTSPDVSALSAAESVSTGPASRVMTGIEAAGGNVEALGGVDHCDESDAAASSPLTVAYLGPDLDELSALGVVSVTVEDPALVIAAYVNEINSLGGIDGRCVAFDTVYWRANAPISSYIEACAHLDRTNPLFFFNFRWLGPNLHCTAFGAPLPELGLNASTLEATARDAGHLLYVDDGAVEHLTVRTAEVGLEAGIITEADRVGLLHGTGTGAGLRISVVEELARHAGLNVAASADIPREFDDLRLAWGSASSPGPSDSLPPEASALLDELERFHARAAAHFEDAGVSVVLATSHWADVRRMMQAAELVGWTPLWLTSDIQPITLATADAPERQAENYFQVSSRRAAGDVVPSADQGCIVMRNGWIDASPFNHRPHTDAWNLLMSVCDSLDVAFAAVSRIDGPVDHLSFIDALDDTHYEAGYGGLISYSSRNRNGAERFRLLKVDPACVLNHWGCSRATTDWLSPVHHMHHDDIDTEDIRHQMEDMGHDHSEPPDSDGHDHSEPQDSDGHGSHAQH